MQQQQPFKLTAHQLWLCHTLETLFFLAVITAGTTGFQAVSQGNYSLPFIGGIVLPAVLAVLAKGWSTSIQGNANFMPAILDTANEVKRLVQQSPTVMPIPVQPQGPAVVQHFHQPVDVPVEAPPPSIRSLNAIPQRPQLVSPIEMPIVQDVAKITTAQVQAMPQVVFPERSFSGVIPVVPQPGQ